MQRTFGASLLLIFSISIATAFFTAAAQASTVEKVKGEAAIVKFDDGVTAEAGDKFFAMENGKKKAILEVVQFKKGRAKVKVLKGTAKEGMSVAVAKKASGKAAAKAQAQNEEGEDEEAPAEDSEEKPKSKKSMRSAGAATLFKDITIGGIAGYAMDSQTVNGVAMTGSGFSAKGFADIPILGAFSLLTRAGVEQFNTTGGTSKTEIMYATADLAMKYALGEKTFVPFLMGGLALHFPISKSSNILNTNGISSTTVFFGGGGINYVISGSSYLHATAEYGMFPPSNDVTTSLIAVRGGMGFRF